MFPHTSHDQKFQFLTKSFWLAAVANQIPQLLDESLLIYLHLHNVRSNLHEFYESNVVLYVTVSIPHCLHQNFLLAYVNSAKYLLRPTNFLLNFSRHLITNWLEIWFLPHFQKPMPSQPKLRLATSYTHEQIGVLA